MKKLMLSLLTAAALSIPASASALPTQNAFRVTIVNGLAGIPAGRFCTPEDVGALVAWLASAASAYVTGQIFLTNGGSVLH